MLEPKHHGMAWHGMAWHGADMAAPIELGEQVAEDGARHLSLARGNVLDPELRVE
jgi:hypothetical protein